MASVYNPPRSAAQVVASYYATVSELTNAEKMNQTSQATQSEEPARETSLLPLTPFVITAVLFLAVLVLWSIRKAKSTKLMVATLVLVLFAASIPSVLKYVQTGSRQQTNATLSPIPRNIVIAQASASSVSVSWTTEKVSIGAVRFAATPLSLYTTTIVVADGGKLVSTHNAILNKLQNGKTYGVEILSGTEWFNTNGDPVHFTFYVRGPQR